MTCDPRNAALEGPASPSRRTRAAIREGTSRRACFRKLLRAALSVPAGVCVAFRVAHVTTSVVGVVCADFPVLNVVISVSAVVCSRFRVVHVTISVPVVVWFGFCGPFVR